MLNETITGKTYQFWYNSTLNSYSQVFFSLDKVLAWTLLLITFFTPHVGITGLLAVLLTNFIGRLSGIGPSLIEEGIYGFNALLFGLFLGNHLQFNLYFFILFAVSCTLLLVVTVWLNGILSVKQLPSLSFPFLITCWITTLATNSFSNIHFREEHIYAVNLMLKENNNLLYLFVHSCDETTLPFILTVYFKTLAGTFFQQSVLAGMLIASGIIWFSRIAFTLSMVGFLSAYYFFSIFGADVNELNQNLVGSNFIFMAIGIGCFYLIPNVYSYLAVLLLTPVLLFLLFFFQKILSTFQLKSFTLSFSVLVTLFLLFLKNRWLHKYLHLVTLQYYRPEKTIYKHTVHLKKFRHAHLARIYLPFWGDWYVSQGYQGKITHLGEWSHALDFVITDEKGKTYNGSGVSTEDFYCFNKPILAPADGYVHLIINYVDDNGIAEVNTAQNWGNSIIIHHLNGLYSQISHVKKDSFKVQTGDYVTRGQILAYCGNSGRSPEPHIHFQMQLTPLVGAKTHTYPLACYIDKTKEKPAFKTYDIPAEGSVISNVELHKTLATAYNFTPGKKIIMADESASVLHTWEIFTDAWNRSYFYCHHTQSRAWFINDGTQFYFYDFEGNRHCLLFYFYLAQYRILLGCYNELTIEDEIPLIHFNARAIKFIQDFLAPFYLFTKSCFRSENESSGETFGSQSVKVRSEVETLFMGQKSQHISFETVLEETALRQFTIIKKGVKKNYRCLNS